MPTVLLARRPVALSILAGIALVALTACAPASPVRHTQGPHHHPATASPSPTSAALKAPITRIPLTCAQLAPAATLNTALGATMTPTPARPDSDWDAGSIVGFGASNATVNGDPADLDQYAALQDGSLNCSWTAPAAASDQGFATAFDMMVMPDAAAYWAQYSSQLDATQTSPFGSNSHINCYEDTGAPGIVCDLNVLVGKTWLNMDVRTGKYRVAFTDAQLFAKFTPLFQSAISALSAATVIEPAWHDPAATAVNLPPSTGAVADTPFSTAIGVPFGDGGEEPDWIPQPQQQAGYDDSSMVAQQLPVNFRYTWGAGPGATSTDKSSNYVLQIEILPAGAWAFPKIVTAESGATGFATLSGIGTKAITYTLPQSQGGDPSDTIIEGTVGEHLYSVDVGDPGEAGMPNTAALAKAVAAYVVTELS